MWYSQAFSPLRYKAGFHSYSKHGFTTLCKDHSQLDRKVLRLMPLGGSITYGVGSSGGYGYRRSLKRLLISEGYQVQMVGSRRSGSGEDYNHEGWRGFRIDQIEAKARASVSKALPHVFTINAGSNECGQDFELQSLGYRMNRILEYLWAASPGSTVILSTLLRSSDVDVEERALHVNSILQGLAQKLEKQRRLVLVDMHGRDGPQTSDLVDGVHPNDAGYQKMAHIWHTGFHEAVNKGFI